MNDVTEKQIFDALRAHLKPARLSQLIVDITKEAMQDPEARNMIVDTLKLTPAPQQVLKRHYNLTRETLLKVYPRANLDALDLILKYAPVYGVNSKKQMCAFLANVIVESNGMNAKRENFNYSAKRLYQVFPRKRIPSMEFATALVAKGQVVMANHLYGGRYGNRPGTNDGWDLRGGGLIQLTFYDNYDAAGRRLGIDLVNNPKRIEELDVSVLAAFDFWRHNGLNQAAEAINLYSNGWQLNTLNSRGVETKNVAMNTGITLVRKLVNGGDNGLEEVADMFQLCMRHM